MNGSCFQIKQEARSHSPSTLKPSPTRCSFPHCTCIVLCWVAPHSMSCKSRVRTEGPWAAWSLLVLTRGHLLWILCHTTTLNKGFLNSMPPLRMKFLFVWNYQYNIQDMSGRIAGKLHVINCYLMEMIIKFWRDEVRVLKRHRTWERMWVFPGQDSFDSGWL